jgi:hypothetical protein
VPQDANIAAPLFNLTRKVRECQWEPEEKIAFQQLKDALLQDTILLLAHPWVEEDKWVVDTDTSARAIGAILTLGMLAKDCHQPSRGIVLPSENC